MIVASNRRSWVLIDSFIAILIFNSMIYYSANHAVIAGMTECRMESCPAVPVVPDFCAGQDKKERGPTTSM